MVQQTPVAILEIRINNPSNMGIRDLDSPVYERFASQWLKNGLLLVVKVLNYHSFLKSEQIIFTLLFRVL